MHQATRLTIMLLLIAAAVAATIYGIDLRRQLFEWSAPIHHTDVFNGFARGRIINRIGVFDIYDKIAGHEIDEDSYGIDYAPLRLAAVGAWASWFETHYPGERWNGSYAHTMPMLTGNTISELLSSVFVFLLVRMWWIRSQSVGQTFLSAIDGHSCPSNPSKSAVFANKNVRKTADKNVCPTQSWIQRTPFQTSLRANLVGFVGGLLFWFNPAILCDAHCWPQWDVWLIPPFLGAVLLACVDQWFFAGVCVIAGAFFKGQILLVSPIFILWPLFQRRWWHVLRFVCGTVLTIALIALPWMIHRWMSEPFSHLGGFLWLSLTIALTGFAMYRFRRRYIQPFAAVAGFLILLLMPLFGASSAWFTVGFEYGTRKFPMLASATGTYSIPTLLRDVFHWSNNMESPVAPIPGSAFTISTRLLMLSIYAVCLVLCSFGAAMHDRRRDARFLVAVITPWICFFTLLTQMNNRYLVWAAGLSAVLIGVDIGLALLGLIVSVICVTGMAQHMLPMDRNFAPAAHQAIIPMQTHMAWPVALAAGVYLYLSIKPSKRRTSAKTTDEMLQRQEVQQIERDPDDEKIPIAVN